MDVAEVAVEGLDVHMLGDFAPLACEASMCPGCDVCSCPLPDKPQQNQAFSGTYTWVGNGMNGLKNKVLKRIWNYWLESAHGDVPVKRVALHVPRNDGKAAGCM